MTAKPTMGKVDPCVERVKLQRSVMPAVNIIGSKKSHKNPIFFLPKRVISSRIINAPMTRSWIASDRAKSFAEVTGICISLTMLMHPGQDDRQNSPEDQRQQDRGKDGFQSAWRCRYIWFVWLDDTL